jgi:HAD superfamily hydrolase (TIGR01509 family)
VTLEALVARLEALLFDLDGVLIDSFDAWVAVLDECRERRGLPPLGPEPVRASWGQGIAADTRTFFPGADAAQLAAEYDEGFGRHVDKVRTIPGAPELVAAARGRGLRTALVTNSPVAMARRVLSATGLSEHLELIAGGDEVPAGKPAPDVVELALRRLEVAPADAALVGDTDLDTGAARAAGVAAIGYRVEADHRIDDLLVLARLVA